MITNYAWRLLDTTHIAKKRYLKSRDPEAAALRRLRPQNRAVLSCSVSQDSGKNKKKNILVSHRKMAKRKRHGGQETGGNVCSQIIDPKPLVFRWSNSFRCAVLPPGRTEWTIFNYGFWAFTGSTDHKGRKLNNATIHPKTADCRQRVTTNDYQLSIRNRLSLPSITNLADTLLISCRAILRTIDGSTWPLLGPSFTLNTSRNRDDLKL